MIGKKRFGFVLCVTFLLLAGSVVCASDSVASQDSFLNTTLATSDIATPISNEVSNSLSPVSSELAGIARKIMEPPVNPTSVGVADADSIKPLPAAPTAIITVAVGFLCVSLVKDRRVWLTVAASLLWAGQTGIYALPQLAAQLSRGNMKQNPPVQSVYLQPLENTQRLRSDIEGTQYIGLLHHLAGIPETKCASKNPSFTQSRCRLNSNACSYQSRKTQPFKAGVIPAQNGLGLLCKCPAEKAERFISFSPAFIFERIPRGPPLYS